MSRAPPYSKYHEDTCRAGLSPALWPGALNNLKHSKFPKVTVSVTPPAQTPFLIPEPARPPGKKAQWLAVVNLTGIPQPSFRVAVQELAEDDPSGGWAPRGGSPGSQALRTGLHGAEGICIFERLQLEEAIP